MSWISIITKILGLLEVRELTKFVLIFYCANVEKQYIFPPLLQKLCNYVLLEANVEIKLCDYVKFSTSTIIFYFYHHK